MIELEVLISTMNDGINNLDNNLDFKSKRVYFTIIHQIINQKKYDFKCKKNIKYYSYEEKGLSKNRNRALENSTKEICLISDDDVKYKKEYLDNILKSFKENSKVDVITFQTLTPDNKFRRKYYHRKKVHSLRTIKSVSSIEIAFRRKSIIENNINFDEKFGLGSHFPLGEETVFLKDCLDAGLKIIYVPLPIGEHPKESTGTIINKSDENNNKLLLTKGALSKRIFPRIYKIFNVVLGLKYYKNNKDKYMFKEVLKIINEGSSKYEKI